MINVLIMKIKCVSVMSEYSMSDVACTCKVLFVDLDAMRLQSVVGDEGRIIPKKIQKALIAAVTDDTGWFVMLYLYIHWICNGCCRAALSVDVFAMVLCQYCCGQLTDMTTRRSADSLTQKKTDDRCKLLWVTTLFVSNACYYSWKEVAGRQ